MNGDGECSFLTAYKRAYGWLKPIGLVQRSAATWRCAAFFARTG